MMRRAVLNVSMAVLLFAGAAASLYALPPGGTGFDDLWYADDTWSEVVGEHYMECYGTPYSWGIRTAYLESWDWGCQIEPAPYTTCSRSLCYWTEDGNGHEVPKSRWCWPVGECY